jgi:hypothetical protein
VSNTFHSLFYFIVEFSSIIVRIAIFLQIRSVPVFDKNFQTKVRFILTRVLLYTLPFTITCVFLIISRSYTDIERLVNLQLRRPINIFCLSNLSFVLRSFHSVLYPLRGTMNAIVNSIQFLIYRFILSSPIGFWKQSKNWFVVVKEIFPFNKKKKMMMKITKKVSTHEDIASEIQVN